MIRIYFFLSATCLLMAAVSRPGSAQMKKAVSIYHKGWIDLNKNGKMDVYEDPRASISARVEDLLSQMTLDEKTCQLVTLYGYRRVLKDPLPTPEWKKEVWKDGIANIDEHLNSYVGKEGFPDTSIYARNIPKHIWAMNQVQKFFIENTRLGIPVDFTNEGIRGVEAYTATDFPTNLAMGATWDADLVYQEGRITGEEGRLLGYTNVYAPILDIVRDQRWGRVEDCYGESPFLAARMGVMMVRAMQRDHTVVSTAKHFAFYSAVKGGREGMARTDPQVTRREAENLLLPAFEAAIHAGLLGIMVSYNDYDGIPMEGSRYWLTTRLRKDFGFKGYLVSDSGALEYLFTKHHVAGDMDDAIVQAYDAGLNVRTNFTPPSDIILPLRRLVKEGRISMKTIDNRVRDVLRVKFWEGTFDHPYQNHVQEALDSVNCPAHRLIALQASRECLVLLKNDHHILPLSKDISSVAVIGPNANDASYAHKHYGPQGVHPVTVLAGIRDELGQKVKINYSRGCNLVDARWPESEILPEPLTPEEQLGIDSAVAAARRSDAVILVLGENSPISGENHSRTSLDLPGRQLDLAQAVFAVGKPTVVVLINGRPLSINWVNKYIPGILEAWYPGEQGGTAVAEALFGDYDPGGKSTVTWPKTVGQIPLNFPTKPDAQTDVGDYGVVKGMLYPFGYGLSYTHFGYSDLEISPETQHRAGNITVSFQVENTGSREGDEVPQLYIREETSSVTTYEKQLRGFQRIHLEPGEKQQISFTLTPDDLKLWNRDMHHVVEPGKFRVMIGSSSEDIRLNGAFEIVPDSAN
ncbi:MAG TPA: glycoside hydrolase family 3 N-terminal domain-containing protein [Chitinophagaceae bacterium]|nr:glycoside hydrolase family 3 N-terminal domain-containing protein [Chitinophagaceae bacterium]